MRNFYIIILVLLLASCSQKINEIGGFGGGFGGGSFGGGGASGSW